MHNNTEIDELLVKYLLKEANEQELKFILKWLNEDKENEQYFESFKSIWRLMATRESLDKVDVDREWNYFRKVLSRKHLRVIAVSAALEKVQSETISIKITRGKSKIFRIAISAIAVASVLLIIGIGWSLERKKQTVKARITQQNNIDHDSLVVYDRIEKNITKKARKIMLPDGSEILLHSNSEIRFKEPFPGNARDIFLSGRADFAVAKDKKKPFIVSSGDISTTALGTKFTVTAYEGENNITVRLHEGKVVVRSIASSKRKLKSAYFIKPGKELLYNRKNVQAIIRSFKTGIANAKLKKTTPKTVDDNPNFPEDNTGSWFMFNNQSLDQVFDQLTKMFKTEIIYSKKDVGRMYFIGKFDSAESLGNILKRIALLNKLKIEEKNNKFFISK